MCLMSNITPPCELEATDGSNESDVVGRREPEAVTITVYHADEFSKAIQHAANDRHSHVVKAEASKGL